MLSGKLYIDGMLWSELRNKMSMLLTEISMIDSEQGKINFTSFYIHGEGFLDE